MSLPQRQFFKLCKQFERHLFRRLCTSTEQELRVKPFCEVQVNVPYHVVIKPLDVYTYPDADRLKIGLIGIEDDRRALKHIQDANNIKIFSGNQKYNSEVTCCIKAPVKANLNIIAQGNISTGSFSGSKLMLRSINGNINMDKYNGEHVEVTSENGNILVKGAVVASQIRLNTKNNGWIKTKRLQGNNAFLASVGGKINVEACYCDSSHFEAVGGDIELRNLHKSCTIIVEDGNLNLTGVDGQFDAIVSNGNADIQLSKIHEDSKIEMKESGELILRLSDECQEHTMFEMLAGKYLVEPNIKLIANKAESNTLYLMPTCEEYKTVKVYGPSIIRVHTPAAHFYWPNIFLKYWGNM